MNSIKLWPLAEALKRIQTQTNHTLQLVVTNGLSSDKLQLQPWHNLSQQKKNTAYPLRQG